MNKFCFWIPSWPNLAARPTSEKPTMLARRDMIWWTSGSMNYELTKQTPWHRQIIITWTTLVVLVHLVYKRNTFTPLNIYFRLVCLMAEILDDLPSATALKIATARQRKDTADEAFKSGNVKDGTYFMLKIWATSRSVCLISFEIVPRGNRFQSITSRLFSLTIQALMYLLGLDKYVFTRILLCSILNSQCCLETLCKA